MGMNRKTGRGAKFLIVFVVIVIIMAAVTFFAGKYAYHLLREYIEYASKQSTEVVLEKDGLKGMIEWMSEKEKEKLPKKFLVSDIEAELWKNGEVYDFAFNIQEFDESDEYMKDIYYRYDSREGKLSKTENVNEAFPTEYDPNAEVDYLDSQIKMLPLMAQMKELDFDRYVVEYSQDRRLQDVDVVIDGRDGNGFSVLTQKEYQQGAGGASDGSSQVVISLTDGGGVMGERIEYICAPADENALVGQTETVMQTDYYFRGEELMLTDDSGETWVASGLTTKQLEETKAVYGQGNMIPENSVYADGNGMFAVFWGETPTLHVSKDDGETWTDFVFQEEYPRLCTSRIVRFLDPENGYVGLGTDWSMGTGGATYIGWTHDGGATWETTPVAVENGWILSGLAFADQSAGMLTMDEQFGENSWPHVLVTENGGASFAEIELPWDTVSEEVMFLNKVDSLKYENGVYYLTLGQGEYGNKDEAQALINQFDSEEEYWQHEFEVYKINLPIEKYLNSVKQDYLNNAATIYSESEHETEHLNSCNEYLQNLQSDLAEKEDYEIME